ncbi:MAG: hypothetical protein JWN07_2974 [Hyphomicrobiales bacterium]|nr:hypothetical protein [Hyphomicrobiales bacterium]
MASLRDADLVAILGEDYARKFNAAQESTVTTAQEREAKRRRDLDRITDIRISLTGLVLAGIGLLAGPVFLKQGFNVQAAGGAVAIALGFVGLAFTVSRKRKLQAELLPAE